MSPLPRPQRPNSSQSRKTISVSDLWDKTLGVGNPTSSDKSAGKQNAARLASVDLTGGGSTLGTTKEYDVPHDLGRVPTICALESVENAAVPGTSVIASGVRQENWSHSHCHVNVTLVSGSFDGCRANFRVSGR
jgi:hypothetical protein